MYELLLIYREVEMVDFKSVEGGFTPKHFVCHQDYGEVLVQKGELRFEEQDAFKVSIPITLTCKYIDYGAI